MPNFSKCPKISKCQQKKNQNYFSKASDGLFHSNAIWRMMWTRWKINTIAHQALLAELSLAMYFNQCQPHTHISYITCFFRWILIAICCLFIQNLVVLAVFELNCCMSNLSSGRHNTTRQRNIPKCKYCSFALILRFLADIKTNQWWTNKW